MTTLTAYYNAEHDLVAVTDGQDWYGALGHIVRLQALSEGWETEQDLADDFRVEVEGRKQQRGDDCSKEELEFDLSESFGISLDDFEQVPVLSVIAGQQQEVH